MLKLAAHNPDPSVGTSGPRILAPGAPPSPGPVPKDLAQHLPFGEALVWWNEKDQIHYGPIALVLLVALGVLGFVSLFAPEFWNQPWRELAKPVAVLISPAAFVLLRERINQRAIMVTDVAVMGIDPAGRLERLSFEGITAVRRDAIRGGLLLEGRRVRVRIPPSLLEDTRLAIASQRRGRVRAATQVDDPTGWLP